MESNGSDPLDSVKKPPHSLKSELFLQTLHFQNSHWCVSNYRYFNKVVDLDKAAFKGNKTWPEATAINKLPLPSCADMKIVIGEPIREGDAELYLTMMRMRDQMQVFKSHYLYIVITHILYAMQFIYGPLTFLFLLFIPWEILSMSFFCHALMPGYPQGQSLPRKRKYAKSRNAVSAVIVILTRVRCEFRIVPTRIWCQVYAKSDTTPLGF